MLALAAMLALQTPVRIELPGGPESLPPRRVELPPPPTRPLLPPAAGPPAPPAPPSRLPQVAAGMRPITNADYPAAALRAGEQGRVHVTLRIDAEGRVAGCFVSRSSGSASLDEASCRLFRERGRFDPALDRAGRPIPWHKAMVLTWSLGSDRR